MNSVLSLSLLTTQWSLVFRAQGPEGDDAAVARRELAERYSGAVERYLRRITRDPDLAADLTQEFALRVLKGEFRRVDPRRGRFRDYVKKVVFNLVIDTHRRRRSGPQPLSLATLETCTPDPDLSEYDRQFLECWRDELLRHAWRRLEEHQETIGQPLHTVLRLKADQPELHSSDMAELLSQRLGKPVNAGWVRQVLYRAREKFVELVRAEVAHSLGNASVEEQDLEMKNLGLWLYHRSKRDS